MNKPGRGGQSILCPQNPVHIKSVEAAVGKNPLIDAIRRQSASEKSKELFNGIGLRYKVNFKELKDKIYFV